MTNSLRYLPHFLIIGGSKSGKWTVQSYLRQHPQISSGTEKPYMLYWFDSTFETNSFGWYRSHFPFKFTKKIVGEIPGTYLNHPLAPYRIKQVIPNVKMINFLRNPVYRAYSAYNHAVIEGWEHSSFEDALNSELEIIEIKETQSEKQLNNIDFVNYMEFSYLRHGLYAENLKEWFKIFPKEQFMHYSTEELDENFNKIMNELFTEFNIKNITLKKIKHQHVGNFKGSYAPMKDSTKDFLIDFYKKHNQKLFELIGKKFNWDE